MFAKITNYVKESINELKRVNWLSRQETFNLTLEVIFFSLIFVFIYGLFDAIFLRILFLLK